MTNLIDISTFDEKELYIINIIKLLFIEDSNDIDINQIRTNFLEWISGDGKKNLEKLSNDNFNDLEEYLHNILFILVRQGNLVELKKWIKVFNIKNLNIFSKDLQNSLVSCAAYHNMFHIVSFLINKGANINTKNVHGLTALHRILKTENNNEYTSSIFSLLLSKNASLTYTDRGEGNTPLHFGMEKKKLKFIIDIIEKSKEKEININIKNKKGLYPIHLFIENVKDDSDLKFFDYIIKSMNIDINEILDKYNNNLLLYCCGKNNHILAKHLIKRYDMAINIKEDKIHQYIMKYIDNNFINIYREVFLTYFINYINESIFDYCKQKNQLMAWETIIYLAYSNSEQGQKLDGDDPLNLFDYSNLIKVGC